MTDQAFQTQVLSELGKLNGRFDTLEGRFDTLEKKVDSLSEDFHDFRYNQEKFNTAIWDLNTQAFQSINDIRSEVISPWKLRKDA